MALTLDLPLQGAGVGGDPYGWAVGLGPQRGRREIGQGLADAGARLCQHHARLALPLARLEGVGGLGGVFGLRGTGLIQPTAGEQLLQPRLRRLRFDGLGAWLTGRRLVLPLGNARPHLQARTAIALADWLGAQGLDHRRGPGPAGARQGLGDRQSLLAAGLGSLGQLRQQHAAARGQGLRLGRGAGRLGHAHGQRHAHRRRRAEPGRADEGIELQRVENVLGARRALESQPPGGQGRVHRDHRRAQGQGLGLPRRQLARPRAVAHPRFRARQDHKRGRQIEGGSDGVHPRVLAGLGPKRNRNIVAGAQSCSSIPLHPPLVSRATSSRARGIRAPGRAAM